MKRNNENIYDGYNSQDSEYSNSDDVVYKLQSPKYKQRREEQFQREQELLHREQEQLRINVENSLDLIGVVADLEGHITVNSANNNLFRQNHDVSVFPRVGIFDEAPQLNEAANEYIESLQDEIDNSFLNEVYLNSLEDVSSSDSDGSDDDDDDDECERIINYFLEHNADTFIPKTLSRKQRRVFKSKKALNPCHGWSIFLDKNSKATLLANDPKDHLCTEFRSKFRVPFKVFLDICKLAKRHGFFHKKGFKKRSSYVSDQWKVLVCLRILGRDLKAVDSSELASIGQSTVNYILHQFCEGMVLNCYEDYVKIHTGLYTTIVFLHKS